MTSTELDGIDRLLLAEAGEPQAAAVLDAPALAAHLHARGVEVTAWCDDWQEHMRLPEDIRPGMADMPQFRPTAVALYRLPKSLGELDEICRITANAGANLFAGAKLRHLTRSMNSVISRHYGQVCASRGAYKARVLRGVKPGTRESDWPKLRFHEDLGLWLAAHGGTFAGNKVDLGTRTLIPHLRQVEGGRVIDLGSGNGVLAALLGRLGHTVTAVDSSLAAVCATRSTAAANDLPVTATWADGLTNMADGSADAIVTNPPFHQGRAKESSPTLDMFTDASRVLVPGGELWCVFNSHLPWRRELAKRVGRTEVVGQNPRYTLTRSTLDRFV